VRLSISTGLSHQHRPKSVVRLSNSGAASQAAWASQARNSTMVRAEGAHHTRGVEPWSTAEVLVRQLNSPSEANPISHPCPSHPCVNQREISTSAVTNESVQISPKKHQQAIPTSPPSTQSKHFKSACISVNPQLKSHVLNPPHHQNFAFISCSFRGESSCSDSQFQRDGGERWTSS